MSTARRRYEGQVAWAPVVSEPSISRRYTFYLGLELVAWS